ncbi:biotin/lipoyl-containing protein [Ralstonia pseudosolanacearum]|uniref:biotin/lipoyl-containing protein n=1 Tax=Ralstonia pseudosolanacearum TaxID=1310165 RepID=UPI003D163A29
MIVFKLPDLGEGLQEAEIVQWHVQAGDTVEAAIRHADGSVEIGLISHAIVFNPGGAFRILDLLSPGSPYFEMAGHGGIAFVAPR